MSHEEMCILKETEDKWVIVVQKSSKFLKFFDKRWYFSYFPTWLKFNQMIFISGDSLKGLVRTGAGRGNLS